MLRLSRICNERVRESRVPSGTRVQLRRSINILGHHRFYQILPENSIEVRYESLSFCVCVCVNHFI